MTWTPLHPHVESSLPLTERHSYFPSICSQMPNLEKWTEWHISEHTIFEGPTMVLVPLSAQGSLEGRQQCSLSSTLWIASIILTHWHASPGTAAFYHSLNVEFLKNSLLKPQEDFLNNLTSLDDRTHMWKNAIIPVTKGECCWPTWLWPMKLLSAALAYCNYKFH